MSSLNSADLPNEIIEILEKDSKSNNIAVVERIFQILTHHYTFEIFFNDKKIVFVSKEFFKEVLEEIHEDRIFKIVLNTTTPLARKIASSQTQPTIETLIQNVNRYLNSSQLDYDYRVVNQIHKYKIRHNLSRKYSIYLSSIIDCLVAESGYKTTINSISKNSVSFDIEVAFPIGVEHQKMTLTSKKNIGTTHYNFN